MLVRLAITACLLMLLGCEKSHDAQSVTDKTTSAPAVAAVSSLSAPPFLSEPMGTTVIETTNEALPIWRKYAKHKPVLAILANTPYLLPIPGSRWDEAAELLKSADDNSLRDHTSFYDTDPVILPDMSLSAALDAGWFSAIVWIFPSAAAPDKLDLATFRKQLTDARLATEREADGFILDQGTFKGKVHGIPLTAAPSSGLVSVDQPLLLHIDVDYFKPLYKGEIKTPLYPLMVETLNSIKNKGWKAAAATVSLSNLGSGLSLRTRFLGKDLAEILRNPQVLNEPIPMQWEQRANALYLENFMQKGNIRELYQKMEQDDPADPSVKYALYHVARQFNEGDEALEYLRQAVQIDPVYALEYPILADLAMEKQKPERAVDMLKLARAARPDDPFILMQLARTCINAGQPQEAKALRDELNQLDWSMTYYPHLAESVEGLKSMLNQ